MEAIKSLYQEEINAYKAQVDELKAQNRRADEKNATLLDKVKDLQELIERAEVANKDLHTAFEHVRDENMKLQLQPVNQQNAIMDRSIEMERHDMALEQVRSQYINLTRESVSWISDKDKLNQKVKFLERECQRFERDNRTLGKQVVHLLKTLEEERGTIIRRANQINEYGQGTVHASDVIDSHLVTFESIEELQKQNEYLLKLVKELTEKEEEREIQIENEDIRRLNSDIKSLQSQLEEVKNDRERIISVFNTILKERDLFKILLCKTRQVEHMTPEIFQRMVSIACSAAGPAITNKPENSQDKDAHITDLKAMISKLEQEMTDLRGNLEVTRSRNEEELNLKTQLLEQAHLKIFEGSQQAEVLKERNEVLESNIAQLTTEFDEIRTKSQKLTFEVEKLVNDKKELIQSHESEKERAQLELYELRAKSQKLSFEVERLEQDKEVLSETLEHQKQSGQFKIDELHAKVQKLTFEVDRLERENEYQKEREKEREREREIEKEREKDRDRDEKPRGQPELSGFLDQIQTLIASRDMPDFYTKLGDIQTLRNHERAQRLKDIRGKRSKRKVEKPIEERKEKEQDVDQDAELENELDAERDAEQDAERDVELDVELDVEQDAEQDAEQDVEREIKQKAEENDKPDEAPPAKAIVLKRRKFN